MSKREFSEVRRRLLQSGVAALASAPVVGLTDGNLLPCSQLVEPQNCVRSPWVYYPLREAALGTMGEAIDKGNEGFPGLVPTTTDTGQWLAHFDWWTGNGIDRALVHPWEADPDRFSSILLPGRSACLIGVQLDKTQASGTSENLLQLGHALPAGEGRGLQLKINSAGRPQITLWDDDGNTFSLAGREIITATNGGQCTLLVYLDHRAQGSRTLSMHQFETGSDVQSTKVESTHNLGAITGGISVDNQTIVGARRLPSGGLDQFYLGGLRGVTILNFGNTPPANVSGIMEALSIADMQPGLSMQGV